MLSIKALFCQALVALNKSIIPKICMKSMCAKFVGLAWTNVANF